MKEVAPDSCRNKGCPFWNADCEESCGKENPQSEAWIALFCSNQTEVREEDEECLPLQEKR